MGILDLKMCRRIWRAGETDQCGSDSVPLQSKAGYAFLITIQAVGLNI